MRIRNVILGFLLAVVSFGAGVYVRLHSTVNTPIAKIKETLSVDMGRRFTGTINVLLLGEDNVEGSSRTDSIALAVVDLDGGTVKVISLPRDTRVSIPGHGFQKLNHAYAYGGVDLLRSTVMSNFNVPIHYYVLVDYGGFARMVDAIGGVEVYVPKRMKYTDRAGGLYIDLPKGLQHLNGEKALHFVRFRHDALGDIGRVQRQQEFVKAVLDKIKSPAIVEGLPQLVREALGMVKTDMPTSLALQLGGFVKDLDKGKVVFTTLPGKPSYIRGISYWVADIEGFKDLYGMSVADMASNLASSDLEMKYGTRVTTAAEVAKVEEGAATSGKASSGGAEEVDLASLAKSIRTPVAILNGTGKKGLGQRASEMFQRMGIEVTYTGNAKHFDYRGSLVLYPERATPEMIQAAKSMAKLCGIRESMVRSGKQAMFASLVLGGDYERIFSNLNQAMATINQ